MGEKGTFTSKGAAQHPFISSTTFAGQLFVGDFDALKELSPDVTVLGVPIEWGECAAGQMWGPRTIRALSTMLHGVHHVEFDLSPLQVLKVVDYGDVPGVGKSNVEESFQKTTETILEILQAGSIPLVLGGDHSITYPILKAYSEYFKGDIGLIHVDAHIDVMDMWGSEKYSCASWLRRSIEEFPTLKGENYTMIGARGFWPDEGDLQWMKDRGMQVFTMLDVEELGIQHCVDVALQRAWKDTEVVYLSFDGDGIDPAYAPGIGLPSPGGLTTREALHVIREVTRKGIHGMDFVELTILQENEAQTSTYLAVHLIMEALTGLAMGGK
jgi:guanidinobutyrase